MCLIALLYQKIIFGKEQMQYRKNSAAGSGYIGIKLIYTPDRHGSLTV